MSLLNGYKEVAEDSYAEVGTMLRRGMTRRLTAETQPGVPAWRRDKATNDLANFDSIYQKELPDWINRLLKDKSNSHKMFKIIRAERRGLLRLRKPQQGYGYPANWVAVAAKLRLLDRFSCVSCGVSNVELHVHHIIYVSNLGTHKKNNLVTLCRECHEKEHSKIFDFGENMVSTDIPPEDIPEVDGGDALAEPVGIPDLIDGTSKNNDVYDELEKCIGYADKPKVQLPNDVEMVEKLDAIMKESVDKQASMSVSISTVQPPVNTTIRTSKQKYTAPRIKEETSIEDSRRTSHKPFLKGVILPIFLAGLILLFILYLKSK